MTVLRCYAAVLCILACAVPSCASGDAVSDRPMSWLSGDRSATASSIRGVLRLSGMKMSPQDMSSSDLSAVCLDVSRSCKVSDEASFRLRAFEVLDAVMSAERRLDEGWKSADQTDGRHAAAYYFLKYRLRFAQALPKIEIASRMAEAGSSSYSMQAMESAIDCLRASAEARGRYEKFRRSQGYRNVNDVSGRTILEFRENLLSIWHSAKSLGRLSPIREIDLADELNKAVVQSVKDTEARARVMDLFPWLKPGTTGNHPDSKPVE